MLTPLKQWICDHCGEIIEKPEDGWLEWYNDDSNRAFEFRIVHHNHASPLKPGGNCYHDSKLHHSQDHHLDRFLGEKGVIRLLSFIDPGPYHDPDFSGPHVVNLREFIELYRRLQVPYYEEARLYWDKAESDGLLYEHNENSIYMPDFLKRIIEQYNP